MPGEFQCICFLDVRRVVVVVVTAAAASAAGVVVKILNFIDPSSLSIPNMMDTNDAPDPGGSQFEYDCISEVESSIPEGTDGTRSASESESFDTVSRLSSEEFCPPPHQSTAMKEVTAVAAQ